MREDFDFCVNLVRERDREGFCKCHGVLTLPSVIPNGAERCVCDHVSTASGFAVCGLLMPSKAQRAYFALRAFNVELASVKGGHNLRRKAEAGGLSDTPTTVALQMRMQWWKDALHEIFDDESSSALTATDPVLQNLSISCWNSPIVRALDRANEEVGFTRRFLDRLIDSRALDLEVQQLATIDDSINYADETVSSLLYLTLETVGVRPHQCSSHVA